MANNTSNPVIGILGGICSGKSTVAAEFAKLGCKVIDADKIVHQLLETDDIKAEISRIFGVEVFDSAGKIDRKKLADAAFADKDKLTSLKNILHPLVFEQTKKLVSGYNKAGNKQAVILDMPLLVEVGWEKNCDKLIFVDCDRKIRLKRASERGIKDTNQLLKREKFQISLDNKAKIAHYIISNNSGLSELARQVESIFISITNKL